MSMSELQTGQQEVFEYVKSNLGEGMIDVELDPKHYQIALERAINRYRQRSSNAVEESYAFLTLSENQNTYILPDEIINGIVAERIEMNDVLESGFILDGYPRTSAQAEALEGELLSSGLSLDLAINLEVPVDEVTQRMLDRSRADDTEEAIQRRLEIYENETAPLLEWFEERNNLIVVDGLGTEDVVFSRLQNVIDGVISGN